MCEGRKGKGCLGTERKDTWQRVIVDGYVPLWCQICQAKCRIRLSFGFFESVVPGLLVLLSIVD